MTRLIVFALLAVAGAFAQNSGSIEGIVVNSNTGSGVAGVSITVYTRQAMRYETTSDGSGAFNVTGMAPGAYEVRFEKDGYWPEGKEPAQPYRVADGQTAPIRIRLEMTRQANVSGRVVDSEGKAVTDAQVKLGYGPPSAVSERGEFSFKQIFPGYYTLLETPKPGQARASSENRVPTEEKEAEQKERIEPVPTYFPSSEDPSAAERIIVRDTDLDGLEIRIRTAPVHRIKGVVLNETGSRVAGARVSLVPVFLQGTQLTLTSDGSYLTLLGPRRAAGAEVAQATTDSNGVFEFPAVPLGDWQITAMTSGSIDSVDYAKTLRTGATTALVGHSDVDGLQIQMGAGFILNGTSDWGDMPVKRPAVFLRPADGQSGVAAMFGGALSPANLAKAPDGSFLVSGRPGRFYIVPSFSAGFYPASVLLGGREVLGQAVDLLPGSPPIHVVYKSAHGSLSGKVDNPASTVLLIPEQIASLGFGRMARPKVDGSFELSGVMPGSYWVAAFSGTSLQTKLDSALVERVASSGVRVMIQDGLPGAVDLMAVPWL